MYTQFFFQHLLITKPGASDLNSLIATNWIATPTQIPNVVDATTGSWPYAYYMMIEVHHGTVFLLEE